MRDLIDSGAGGEIVLLNDPLGDAEQHALLMECTTRSMAAARTPVGHGEGAMVLNGQSIRLTQEKTIEAMPLAELWRGPDGGLHGRVQDSAPRSPPIFGAGVKKVVVSAPVQRRWGAEPRLRGEPGHLYDGSQSLITAASCTTKLPRPGGQGDP